MAPSLSFDTQWLIKVRPFNLASSGDLMQRTNPVSLFTRFWVDRGIYLQAAMALTGVLMVACGGGSSSPAPVTPKVEITVVPGAVSMKTNATQAFAATVTGTTNTSVTWTASAGTITVAGVFTAPSTPGTVTVTATSQADTTKKATAIVTVTAGTGTIQITANAPYSTRFRSTLSGSVTWSLTGVPTGMVLQPTSGVLHWTPLAGQTGSYHSVATATNGSQSQSFDLDLVVVPGAADPAGLFVSPDGDDAADGSSLHPFRTLRQADRVVTPGTTIYLRGGEYRNAEFGQPWSSRTEGSLARITVPGNATAPILLRPHGNEYVRLKSDVTALSMAGASYWTVQGLELVGMNDTMNEDSALSYWWSETLSPVNGGGIQANRSDHLVIRDCIIHDFPDPGISVHGAEYLTVVDNVVYNNAWWSHGGTHGIVSSDMVSTSSGGGQETILYSGNLVFGNQSLLISHVFSKGTVSLTIDEGGGMHLQDTGGTFSNGVRVQNNLAMFNGKAGLVLNTMDHVSVVNNGFYQNARVVGRSAEISIGGSGGSTLETAVNNLFQPRLDRVTFNDSTGAFLNIGANATTGTPADGTNYPSVLRLPQVFTRPEALDFSAAPGVPIGMGLSGAQLQVLAAKIGEYGITVQAPTQVPNLSKQKAVIFSTWPASQSSLVLVDKDTGYSYTYAQRCQWPNPPSANVCP